MSADARSGGFPPEWLERWRVAHGRIDHAGYGETVAAAYRLAGPLIAAQVDPAFATGLASTISLLAIRSGRRAAAMLPEAALEAGGRLADASAMRAWAGMIEEVARKAPDCAAGLLAASGRLLAQGDRGFFVAFVRMGLGESDPERRRAFLSLESAEARRLLDGGEAGGLAALRNGLRLYLGALWAIAPPLAEAPADAPEAMRRRAGMGGGGIRLPAAFPGFEGAQSKPIYRATLAHIGAHHHFTRTPFKAAGLKPLQIALVSLIEDARVERLAAARMPGLAGVWRPFHVARPEGPPIAIALMARLARALADPDHADPHGWIDKGRRLFEEAAAADIGDQGLSRRIGGLLGNDIGQMRLQFDARTYVVQPAYRDDNLGIWDFGDDAAEAPVEMEALVEGARIERRQSGDGRRERGDDGETAAGRLREAADGGVPVARYPEYDHVTGRSRPDWCTLREMPARPGTAGQVAVLRDTRSDLVGRLSAMIRASKVSRQQRIRRQAEGDFLDMEASIAAAVARRAGEVPDTRVYGRHERRSRDMSVLVLADASRSTGDRLARTAMSVLDVERLATAFLGRAMAELGDPFAVAAFCSDTHRDVRYFRIKDFGQPFDDGVLARLAGLSPDYSTRLGAAIRHAGGDLRRQRSYRRLLLIITDGEPSDIDVDDRRYLVEDARAAVQELNREAIDVFCVALDRKADAYTQRIFGRRGALQLDSVESLPAKLPALYLKLRG